MILETIKQEAQQIPNFPKLPITAQISLLYARIEEARELSIPLYLICEALNESGSSVTLRYFREALSVVRAKMKKRTGIATQPAAPNPQRPDASKAIGKESAQGNGTKSKAKLRDEKANSYMNNQNPLMKHLEEKG